MAKNINEDLPIIGLQLMICKRPDSLGDGKEYVAFTGYFCIWDGNQCEPLSVGSTSALAYSDLTISAQMTLGGTHRPRIDRPDGAYKSPYTVRLSMAQAMVKTLSRLERKLDQYQEKDGSAKSAGQHFLRAAKALGATFACWQVEAPGERRHGNWIKGTLADAMDVIDRRERDAQNDWDENQKEKQARLTELAERSKLVESGESMQTAA